MLISAQHLTSKTGDLIKAFFMKKSPKNQKYLNYYLPAGNIYWTGSGREALRQILSQVDGEKVGIPAFTCHVVLDAVKRSGKLPIFYDSGVIAETSEIKKIINNVDVLLVCHNFGFMPEMDKISDLCKKHKVILIEDCAQALGARYQGKLAGSFGDYAFYSFGISKNLGFCGGMIVTKKQMNIRFKKNYPFSKLFSTISKVLISPLFFNKYLYGINRRFLQDELAKEQEELSYRNSNFAKKVILQQVKIYDQILNQRKRNAEYCLDNINISIKKNNNNNNNNIYPNIEVLEPIKDNEPAWLYFVIMAENRNKLLKHLLNNGVELTVMKTFQCFDAKSRKAHDAEQNHLVFALYRNFSEIKDIVKNSNGFTNEK